MNENVYPRKKKHLNPFYGILEKSANHNARTLRTSFIGKLGDAVNVFVGANNHLGLFDYLLVVPFLVEKADEWLEKQEIGLFYNKQYNFFQILEQLFLGY